MKDLLQVRRIPVKEDPSFPILQDPSQHLSDLFKGMREIVLQDRDTHDKASRGESTVAEACSKCQ